MGVGCLPIYFPHMLLHLTITVKQALSDRPEVLEVVDILKMHWRSTIEVPKALEVLERYSRGTRGNTGTRQGLEVPERE